MSRDKLSTAITIGLLITGVAGAIYLFSSDSSENKSETVSQNQIDVEKVFDDLKEKHNATESWQPLDKANSTMRLQEQIRVNPVWVFRGEVADVLSRDDKTYVIISDIRNLFIDDFFAVLECTDNISRQLLDTMTGSFVVVANISDAYKPFSNNLVDVGKDDLISNMVYDENTVVLRGSCIDIVNVGQDPEQAFYDFIQED